MIKFENQYDETTPKTTIEIPKDADLNCVFESFLMFLQLCTYDKASIDLHIVELAEQIKADTVSDLVSIKGLCRS